MIYKMVTTVMEGDVFGLSHRLTLYLWGMEEGAAMPFEINY